MTKFVPLTTLPGDRWDLIAWRAYGDAGRYGPIIEANRQRLGYTSLDLTAIPPSLPAGVTLLVPILDAPAAATAPVPPWRTA